MKVLQIVKAHRNPGNHKIKELLREKYVDVFLPTTHLCFRSITKSTDLLFLLEENFTHATNVSSSTVFTSTMCIFSLSEYFLMACIKAFSTGFETSSLGTKAEILTTH